MPYPPSNWENCESFRSRHPGGVQFACADGSVHFVSDGISLPVYRALATIRLDGREMGQALMARLLGDGRGDYVAPVELVERASLQAPRIPVNPLFTPLSAATR